MVESQLKLLGVLGAWRLLLGVGVLFALWHWRRAFASDEALGLHLMYFFPLIIQNDVVLYLEGKKKKFKMKWVIFFLSSQHGSGFPALLHFLCSIHGAMEDGRSGSPWGSWAGLGWPPESPIYRGFSGGLGGA